MQSMMLCLDGITVMCQYSLFMFVEFFQRQMVVKLIRKIKKEARCWVLAGAKHLREISNFEE
jgi:hypothetical protein